MKSLRVVVATELARFFAHHIIAELAKSPLLQQKAGYDGRTAKDVNESILARLRNEFPGIENSPAPPFNLIEEWAKRNRFVYRYEDYVFERYNRLYIERLLALRDHSPGRIADFKAATLENFQQFDYTQTGFSISFLIRVENNMRELMREIMQTIPGIDHGAAWEFIFDQSKEYQETVNEVFEKRLQDARDESDRLLHNILPASVALELKKKHRVTPVHIDSATVLFTDFKGFTQISEQKPPSELVRDLDECFSIFDRICQQHGLEKIKTIGDSFMCAGGVPEPNFTHVFDVALAAIKMRNAILELKEARAQQWLPYWDVRIGFHTGPVVAGVIGNYKFSYDIWGDTVNTASRMESSGEPGRVNVSAASAELLRPLFLCTERGSIAAKNKGPMTMFFVEDLKPRFGSALSPSEEFYRIYQKIKGGARIELRKSASL